MKLNGKMHEIDEGTRQGILNYSLLASYANDRSSTDDIVKLTCGEIASIPYGNPIKSAKLV